MKGGKLILHANQGENNHFQSDLRPARYQKGIMPHIVEISSTQVPAAPPTSQKPCCRFSIR